MPERYRAERRNGAWHVVDASSGDVVSSYPPGPTGAGAATAAARARNHAASGQGRTNSGAGGQLRTWRNAHGLTQAQLAEKLGVAWLTLQRWESGYAGVPSYLFLALKGLESEL